MPLDLQPTTPMNEPAYMTQRGRTRLVRRVKELEQQLRTVLGSKAEAAEVGGNAWHDNFAFEQLCRDEAMLRRRIAEAQVLLDRAAAPPPVAEGDVGIGFRVELESEAGVRRAYLVVGYGESNPDADAVEYASPLGRALFLSHLGDELQSPTPKLRGVWTITDVRPAEPFEGDT